MKFHRIENPAVLEELEIASLLDAGAEYVVLQFSTAAAYSENLLGRVNLLCERFGSRLNVRFYGHYGSEFDCRVLRHIPFVRSLNLDCLTNGSHLECLDDLPSLEEFAFGVFEASIPSLLESRALARLRRLVLASTRKNNIDLAPLKANAHLEELFINGHTAHIEALADLSKLQKLSLGGIGKRQSLTFIKSITSLKVLTCILGGRTDVSDLAHGGLEQLEILRVLGISEINLAVFPRLERLRIEDQLRLEELDVRPVPRLQRLSLSNCKKLAHVLGIGSATALESLRIGQTVIDLDEVLNHLPASVKALTLYSPSKAIDNKLQLRIASLGLPPAYYIGAP